jgi:hypothetical protein
MSTSISSVNSASATPILDTAGAIAIIQATQFELADKLQDSLDSRIQHVRDLALQLHVAQSLAARLQQQMPPAGSTSTTTVLGDNLDDANALQSDLAQVGVSIDAPVRYPVIEDNPSTQQVTLVWMTAEQRQALSSMPQAGLVGFPFDAAAQSNPDLNALTSWGADPPPTATDMRIGVDSSGKLDGNIYICYDNNVNRPVTVTEADRVSGLLPAVIDSLTTQLEAAQKNADADISALVEVLTDANQTAATNRNTVDTNAEHRTTENQRVDQRATDVRRDQAFPDLRPLAQRVKPRTE